MKNAYQRHLNMHQTSTANADVPLPRADKTLTTFFSKNRLLCKHLNAMSH